MFVSLLVSLSCTTTTQEPVERTNEVVEVVEDGEDAKVERGAYVAKLGGCVICHSPTAEGGQPWSGGFEYTEGELGTWRSSNISQDEQTGIGAWTDEQIILAVREGLRPDGSRLLPMMPYPFFNAMSDEDAEALVAFLRTLPAVENTVAPSDMKIPPVEMPPAAGRPHPPDDEAAQGEYMVTLAHCAMCHTPLDEKGAPKQELAYAGGMPFAIPPAMGSGTVYASNITPHEGSGIGLWTEDQVVDGFTRFVRPSGDPVIGPMMMYAPGWSALAEEDARRMARHLKGLKPIENVVPTSMVKPPDE